MPTITKILLILLFTPTVIFGQIRFSGKATGRHKKAIEEVKDSRNRFRKAEADVKEVLKDTAYLYNRPDSLYFIDRFRYYEAHLDSVDLAVVNDSLRYFRQNFRDSLTSYQQKFESYKEYGINEYNPDTAVDVYNNYEVDFLKKKLQLLEDMAETRMIEEFELTEFTGTSSPFIPEDPSKQFLGPDQSEEISQEEIQQLASINQRIPDLPLTVINPEQMGEVFADMPRASIDEAQEEIKGLKKKYSSVNTTTDLSSAVKRNSLADKPFHRRLQFGGTVDIASTDPLILDIDLQLGYRLNKHATLGAGGIYRKQFTNSNYKDLVGDAYGYSGFLSYEIVKSFFGYAEYRSITDRKVIEQSGKANWETAYYLGIGKAVSLGKRLEMTLIFLYDLNHKNNDLTARPYSMRVGYRIR